MSDKKVADANFGNWSDRWLPNAWQPYLRLMRLDRPVGVWLLLWPCFWGLLIGFADTLANNNVPSVWQLVHYVALFVTGAIIMRGAGCAYNDLVDYKFDAQVERTKSRPLPAGDITTKQAKYFLFYLLISGFLVLIQFNWFSVFVGASSLVLVATYPWMKRYTYWPQAFLGLTFNWGALIGFTALTGYLSLSAIFLYIAGFFWTIGYDTIYAHQDKDDDMMVGLKSTAILFGNQTKTYVGILYSLTLLFFGLSGYFAGIGLYYLLILLPISAHLFWQIYKLKLDDPENCLQIFKSNILFGGIITLYFGFALLPFNL